VSQIPGMSLLVVDLSFHLIHTIQLSDNKDADVTLALRSFREGDRVKAVIRSIDLEKRRISFGLKPSYFDSEDAESADEVESEAAELESKPLGVVEELEDTLKHDNIGTSDADDLSSAEDEDTMQIDIDEPSHLFSSAAASQGAAQTTSSVLLKLQGGFQWSGNNASSESDVASESSSDENEDGDQTARKKKRRRKEIEQDLTADMHTKAPESNSDFERLLLGSPNSSYLWVQYMSFQLQLSEVDKAREIGKRALQTINFREEQEKMNVWIALLNVENVYGTEETLEATFKEAARHNDSKTIHLRLAFIFNEAGKHEVRESNSFKTPMLKLQTESRRAIQENMQEIWPEFQSLDFVWGTLPPQTRVRGC
jgi:rRNA biogenesis protein RRP5